MTERDLVQFLAGAALGGFFVGLAMYGHFAPRISRLEDRCRRARRALWNAWFRRGRS